jgi:hypothetical protein
MANPDINGQRNFTPPTEVEIRKEVSIFKSDLTYQNDQMDFENITHDVHLIPHA